MDNFYLHNHENKIFGDLFNINKLRVINLQRRFLDELLTHLTNDPCKIIVNKNLRISLKGTALKREEQSRKKYLALNLNIQIVRFHIATPR